MARFRVLKPSFINDRFYGPTTPDSPMPDDLYVELPEGTPYHDNLVLIDASGKEVPPDPKRVAQIDAESLERLQLAAKVASVPPGVPVPRADEMI